MRTVILLLLVGCGDADRIQKLEERVAVLELRHDEQLVERVAQPKVTEDRFIGEIQGINRSLGSHEDQLQRMQSYMLWGGELVRKGWWCGTAERCGRSPRECGNYDRRTVSLSGPQATGSDCAHRKTAWCPKDNTFFGACQPTPCAGCVETE